MSVTAILGWACMAACAHATIPGTTIEDTGENREILDLVQKYQGAMEALNPEAVLALVSPDYFEDNATASADDDYDYNGLRQSLSEDFKRTKRMKVELRVDAIDVDGEEAYAEMFYRVRAHNEYPSGTQWETSSDRTRLRLKRSGPRWLIVGGL